MYTRNVVIKKALFAVAGGVVLAAFSGCVVTPYPANRPAYVEPYYPSPGVSWVWEFNPSFGWGWHHPQHGWYRGGGPRNRGHR